MLNTERAGNYQRQRGIKLTEDTEERAMTPAQWRRLRKKQHAHAHFPEGSCDRCRQGHLHDVQRSVAAPGPRNKWSRS